jgi:ferredoxin--NADP+ reductase
MVDGTGMCGGCRVVTADGPRFACVDGPEFDAHAVDFENLARRNRMYAAAEAEALREFQQHPDACVREAREGCRLEAAHPEVTPAAAAGEPEARPS